MKKIRFLIIALLIPLTTQAAVNVQYFLSWGVYPYLADPTATDPGTGLLSLNGTGSTIFQLIYSPSSTRSDVDLTLGDYVSGDNQMLQTVAVSGAEGFDEWGLTLNDPPYFNQPSDLSGSVFVRIFHDASPEVNEYYFDSDYLTLQPTVDFNSRQILYIDPDWNSATGVALDRQIVPEPSVLAFLGLGGLAALVRRRLQLR